MKTIVLALGACMLATAAVAQTAPTTQALAPSCKAQASEKNLAGAALNSFF